MFGNWDPSTTEMLRLVGLCILWSAGVGLLAYAALVKEDRRTKRAFVFIAFATFCWAAVSGMRLAGVSAKLTIPLSQLNNALLWAGSWDLVIYNKSPRVQKAFALSALILPVSAGVAFLATNTLSTFWMYALVDGIASAGTAMVYSYSLRTRFLDLNSRAYSRLSMVFGLVLSLLQFQLFGIVDNMLLMESIGIVCKLCFLVLTTRLALIWFIRRGEKMAQSFEAFASEVLTPSEDHAVFTAMARAVCRAGVSAAAIAVRDSDGQVNLWASDPNPAHRERLRAAALSVLSYGQENASSPPEARADSVEGCGTIVLESWADPGRIGALVYIPGATGEVGQAELSVLRGLAGIASRAAIRDIQISTLNRLAVAAAGATDFDGLLEEIPKILRRAMVPTGRLHSYREVGGEWCPSDSAASQDLTQLPDWAAGRNYAIETAPRLGAKESTEAAPCAAYSLRVLGPDGQKRILLAIGTQSGEGALRAARAEWKEFLGAAHSVLRTAVERLTEHQNYVHGMQHYERLLAQARHLSVQLRVHEIAHHLKNRFQHSLTLLDRLGDPKTTNRDGVLRELQAELRKMAKWSRNLLGAGGVANRRSPCNLSDLLKGMRPALEAAARQRSVALRVHLDEILSLPVHACQTQLEFVVLTLVDNSLAESTVSAIDISVDAHEPRTGCIRVRDDGPGVSPGLENRIFLPGVTGRRDGTGYGLFLSKQIADEHEGSLSYRAAPSGGACFEFRLPMASTAQETRETT